MGKNKIILISTDPTSGKGGIATSVANCLRVLKNHSVECEVIVTHRPGVSKLKATSNFIKSAYSLLKNNVYGNLYFLHVGPKGSLIRKIIIALIIKFKKGTIITQYHSPAFYNYIKEKRAWRLALILLARISDENLALNEYWRRLFTRSLGIKFKTLPNPLSQSKYKAPLSDEKTQSNIIKVICASRLVEEKNIQELIRLAEINPSLNIYIAGGGEYERTLREMARRSSAHQRIIFMGWVDNSDLRTILRDADIFVLPSRYDSFGMVYIEALCEGTPVIAPTLPAVVHTLKGLTGVAHADTAKDIDSAIEKVIYTPKTEIRNSVVSKFGEEAYFSKLKSIIGPNE